MWPRWLAETLERSSHDPRLDRGAKSRLVPDREPVVEALDPVDWDEATGLSIHDGYEPERVD